MRFRPVGPAPASGQQQDHTGRQLAALMWGAMGWALTATVLAALGWAILGANRPADLLASLIGSGLAVVFLSSGLSIHLLARGGSFAGAMLLFLLQLGVLGVLGLLILRQDVLARVGSGPVPLAASMAMVALAWTAGVVVAGARRHQRILQDRRG